VTKPFVTRSIALAIAFLLGPAAAAPAQQGWGDIKGQVIFGPAKIPAMPDANVDKDKEACLAKGPIKTDDLIVGPKTRGVKYVLVFLQDLKDSRKHDFAPPVHPKLQKFPKQVVIDQPCCTFEPRVVALREGQELVVKNPMKIADSFKIEWRDGGPNVNLNIPAGDKVTLKGFAAKATATPYSCPAHGWMKGHAFSFKHPYFAVTDKDGRFDIKNAPSGKYRLVFWHEKDGWVVMKGRDLGLVIQIKAGQTTKIGPVKLTPPKG